MAGAIMEKVWGLFGMDPAEDIEDEELEGYEEEEEIEEELEEQEERKIWGRVSGVFSGVSGESFKRGSQLRNFSQ